MYKFYSDEVKKSVIEDYKDGMKVADIEKRHGIPKGSIGHMLTEAGVPRRRNRNAPPKKCPNCGKESKEQTARFCCWCGTPILTKKEKIIETAEHLFPMVAFCPETRRDGVQQAIKDIIAYIKENCKG